MILGIPWIRQVNPEIDWEKGTIDIKQSRMKHQYPEKYKNVINLFQMKIDHQNQIK